MFFVEIWLVWKEDVDWWLFFVCRVWFVIVLDLCGFVDWVSLVYLYIINLDMRW